MQVKNEITLSGCIKTIFRVIFDNLLVFALANAFWFIIVVLPPLFFYKHGTPLSAFFTFFVLLTFSSSFFLIFTAQKFYAATAFSFSRLIVRVWTILAIWLGLFFLFLLTAFFYAASIASHGSHLLNSFFFFFSLWLCAFTFGLIIFWAPLSLLRKKKKDIFFAGLFFYIKRPLLTLGIEFLFVMICFFSFIFLFFLFMPIFWTGIFCFYEYLTNKN